ncbi:MAG: Crp/Fnr family transcriptional regulator [bacterium]
MTEQEKSFQSLSIFSDCSDGAINRLEDRSWSVEGKSGSPIYYADDTANLVYFLMDGRIRLFYPASGDREITLEYLESGDLFGEFSLVQFESRGEAAETIENAVLKVIPGDFFRGVMEEDSGLFSRVFDYLSKRRRKIQNRLKTLVYEDARKKVQYVLLDISGHLGVKTKNQRQNSINITHGEIAQMAGLARPTTTKVLNKLEDDELITIGNSEIEIVNSLEMKEAINLIK